MVRAQDLKEQVERKGDSRNQAQGQIRGWKDHEWREQGDQGRRTRKIGGGAEVEKPLQGLAELRMGQGRWNAGGDEPRGQSEFPGQQQSRRSQEREIPHHYQQKHLRLDQTLPARRREELQHVEALGLSAERRHRYRDQESDAKVLRCRAPSEDGCGRWRA